MLCNQVCISPILVLDHQSHEMFNIPQDLRDFSLYKNLAGRVTDSKSLAEKVEIYRTDKFLLTWPVQC